MCFILGWIFEFYTRYLWTVSLLSNFFQKPFQKTIFWNVLQISRNTTCEGISWWFLILIFPEQLNPRTSPKKNFFVNSKRSSKVWKELTINYKRNWKSRKISGMDATKRTWNWSRNKEIISKLFVSFKRLGFSFLCLLLDFLSPVFVEFFYIWIAIY